MKVNDPQVSGVHNIYRSHLLLRKPQISALHGFKDFLPSVFRRRNPQPLTPTNCQRLATSLRYHNVRPSSMVGEGVSGCFLLLEKFFSLVVDEMSSEGTTATHRRNWDLSQWIPQLHSHCRISTTSECVLGDEVYKNTFRTATPSSLHIIHLHFHNLTITKNSSCFLYSWYLFAPTLYMS